MVRLNCFIWKCFIWSFINGASVLTSLNVCMLCFQIKTKNFNGIHWREWLFCWLNECNTKLFIVQLEILYSYSSTHTKYLNLLKKDAAKKITNRFTFVSPQMMSTLHPFDIVYFHIWFAQERAFYTAPDIFTITTLNVYWLFL